MEWWSERYCAKAMGRAGLSGRLWHRQEDGKRIEYLLEYDRGTENLDRVAAKLEGYENLQTATGVRRYVLFSVRTKRRGKRSA